jgi:predicted lipid-binding transport protein (Tim44 family)
MGRAGAAPVTMPHGQGIPRLPVPGAGAAPHARCGRRAHIGDMGRMIAAILGAILAAWVAVLAIGGIVAMARTFAIIGLIAVVVAIVVWLLARRRK